MHPSVRKQSFCPNCGHLLGEADNFCPRCGQENTTRVVAFGTLVAEVAGDFFSWDSRWSQTVAPFLFRPGRLTNEFIAGRRMRYMPPLRLYFFMSLLCFSAAAYYMARGRHQADSTEKSGQLARADSLRRAVLANLRPDLPAGQRNDIDRMLGQVSLEKTSGGLINLPEPDDSVVFRTGGDTPKATRDTLGLKQQDDVPDIESSEWGRLLHLIQNPALTERQILDSLRWEDNRWNRLKVGRAIRFKNSDKEAYLDELAERAPVFLFLLMPFMALVMKLLYVRRRRLYIEHLIFMLHFHAFAFFLIAIDIVLDNELPDMNMVGILVPVILIYLWAAMYNVYRQGWLRTTVKMFTFLLLYSFVFSLVAVAGVVAAAVTY